MFWLIDIESVLITNENKANFLALQINNGIILLDFLQKTH